jgi:flagella synthesis protein FlgN
MTRGRALADIVRGVGQDAQAYRELQGLLEEQHAAALRPDPARLTELAARVTGLVEVLEARRAQREATVATLVGAGARMPAILPLLPEVSRHAFEAAWNALEAQVLDCKRLNARNGRLMTEQHQLMQRLLRGDADTYAPA